MCGHGVMAPELGSSAVITVACSPSLCAVCCAECREYGDSACTEFEYTLLHIIHVIIHSCIIHRGIMHRCGYVCTGIV